MPRTKPYDYASVRQALEEQRELGRIKDVSATWLQSGSARITVTDHRRSIRMTVDEAYCYLQGLVAPMSEPEPVCQHRCKEGRDCGGCGCPGCGYGRLGLQMMH